VVSMMKTGRSAKWIALASMALYLAACSRNPATYMASGDKYFQAGKYSEAVIQYRNAVQVSPRLAQAHYKLAMAFLQAKSLQEAYKELWETVTLDPANGDAQLQFAALSIAAKKYDEAKAAAAKVLTLDPKNSRAHEILGEQSALTSDTAGAVREFQAAITLAPRRVQSYFALAAVFASRGDFSGAEAAFKQAIEANPESEPARMSLGDFYFSQRKFGGAEEEMRAASRLAPRDPLPLLELAKDYLAEGNPAEAEKVCAELKTIAPDDPRAYRALALFYVSTKQRVKAAAELQSLRTLKPKDPWVGASLAETLLNQNRIQEASIPTQELLAADPNDPRALLSRGRILISQRKYPEARAALEQATKGAPKAAAAWYFLGVAQRSTGLAGDAKASFDQAHKLSPAAVGPEAALAELEANSGAYERSERLAEANPSAPVAEVAGARAELAKGNRRKAEQLVQAALEHNPISLPALEILLRLYASEGKLPEAVRRISALVAQYPQNAGLRFLQAAGYFNLKDFQRSEESARQAIALDPQTPDAHTLMGAIDEAKGLAAQAANEYRAAIEVSPNKTSNYMALAHLDEAGGKWDDARAVLEKAHAVDPASPAAKNDLAYVYLNHGGDTTAALSLAQEAKRALPESAAVADTFGWALYKSRSYGLAITQLSEGVKKAPGNPEFLYHLGMAYLAANRFEPAAQSLQRALSDNPNFADAVSAKAALDAIAKRQPK
jgi:cellulose synthase operon protein C